MISAVDILWYIDGLLFETRKVSPDKYHLQRRLAVLKRLLPTLFADYHNCIIQIHETSCFGNTFRITGPLWEEFIGHQWIPLQRFSMWSFDVCFIGTGSTARTQVPLKITLTRCCLVTPFGRRHLGQNCIRQWLGAWWHQGITWTNLE